MNAGANNLSMWYFPLSMTLFETDINNIHFSGNLYDTFAHCANIFSSLYEDVPSRWSSTVISRYPR